jgi:hypothetical protein
MAAISLSSATFTARKRVFFPSSASSALPRSWSRPVKRTFTPSATNMVATAVPMPRVAPVTIATLP